MLFVTGANGHFAGEVIANLRAAGHADRLVVGTRDARSARARELADAGIAVCAMDFDEPSTLVPALAGVEKLLITPTWAPNSERLRQNRAAIDAAKAAGVRHIVYASFINARAGSLAEHNQLVHYPTEQAIKASGLEWTVLRHALYAEMMIGDLAETLKTGLLRRAGGSARSAYIARDDLGISAARVLADEGHAGRTYTETMEETISGDEIAALMTDVFATPVAYRAIPAAKWPDYMSSEWGVPIEAARSSLGTMRAVETGEFDIATTDYAAITGHTPRTFGQFLEAQRDAL